jgi:hypothetical protein
MWPTRSTSSKGEALAIVPNENGKKPWFGPKRIGYGRRPQTWQGWLVAWLSLLVVLLVVLGHH